MGVSFSLASCVLHIEVFWILLDLLVSAGSRPFIALFAGHILFLRYNYETNEFSFNGGFLPEGLGCTSTFVHGA
jgi:hypothetical protein